MQGLADVDVAQPRDDALVEQGGLHVLDLAGEGRFQMAGVEVRAQGLGAQAGEPSVVRQSISGDQVHVAEAAGVEIGDPGAGVGLEHDVGVLVLGGGLLAEHPGLAAIGPFDLEAAGHAQVHHQGIAPVQAPQQILGPPLQLVDPRPGEPLHEPLRQREAKVRPARLHPLQPRPLEHRLQAASDRLDLGKLRHVA